MADKKRQTVFELLAPAGSFEIFQAVIAAGADAVYVGGSLFGARAYANNLSDGELSRAVDFAHLHGRKVYLTVNTLLKNTELRERLYDYLLPLYERGLDAVIVQDIGVLSFIRAAFPKLAVHASTQMTVTGTGGVKLLQELGVSRIVMARETSLAEMKHIYYETGAQLEAFVHGALCYSYSGQCLFSSVLGGRSGNRGRCAQPCRLAYSVLDERRRECRTDAYVLSLKDLCGIENLNGLREAGVYSLKIEGRMKQLPYAAGVVACYRKYIDQYEARGDCTVAPADLKTLSELGSRCGFTDGYYGKKRYGMVTLTKPGYESRNEALQEQITNRYASGILRRHASAELTLVQGQPARYEVRCGSASASAYGPKVTEAKKTPLVRQDVVARMRKTGDTFFEMDEIAVEMGDHVFLPNGALNRLRRDALAALSDRLLAPFKRCGNVLPQEPKQALTAAAPGTVCLIENKSLLPVVLACDEVTSVCLDAAAYGRDEDERSFCGALEADVLRCREAGKSVSLALPRIFGEQTREQYQRMAKRLCALPFEGILVRNYEELFFVRTQMAGIPIAVDYNMYTYNDAAASAFSRLGAVRNTIPLELNKKEILHRDNRASEMLVYGRYPLMVSAQCVRRNTGLCSAADGRPYESGICYLRDRYRTEFPVKSFCGGCYNVIYNSLPVLLFSVLAELEEMGVRRFRMDFTVETAEQTDRILALYAQFVRGARSEYPKEWQSHYTNGHYYRGVE